MRKRLLSALTLLTFALALSAQQVYNETKMSGYLQKLAQKETNARARGTQSHQQKVCVLIKFNEPSSAEAIGETYDCQILDSIGGIYFVNIPICQLWPMSMDERVQRIDAHEMPRPTMNEVPEYVGAASAWSGEGLPQAFTGKGIMAGVVDIGFDFTHPMFYDSIGKTRISRFYDMSRYEESGNLGLAYEADNLTALRYSPRAVNQTHGTHVASLMAGSCVNGRKAAYSGIAPQSNIALAEVAVGTADSTDNQSGSSVTMLLGIKRLFDYADELGQPCVVNLSMGGWVPITEPLTLENEAIAAMNKPGHIIVASAGNDGEMYVTLEKPEGVHDVWASFRGKYFLGNDTISTHAQSMQIDCYLLTKSPQIVTFVINTGVGVMKTLRFNTEEIKEDTLTMICEHVTPVQYQEDSFNFCVVKEPSLTPNQGDEIYHFIITPNNLTFDRLSEWLDWFDDCLSVMISSDYPCEMVSSPTGISFQSCKDPFGSGKYGEGKLTNAHSIGWPAESKNVIAVGAQHFNNRDGFDNAPFLASFSSCGPSWDGAVKPDVVAPGVIIDGAYNRFSSSIATESYCIEDTITGYDNSENYIAYFSGTSMSSPIVAGAVALWLQAKPDLTTEEVRTLLAKTCRPIEDWRSNGYPNNRYGYGEIDVYAGLLHLLSISNIEGLSAQQPTGVNVKLVGRTLSVIDNATGLPVDADVTLIVFSLDGKVVASAKTCTLDLSSLRNGVYAVQVNANEEKAKGSTLIRL